jgi:hypothetical protein
MPSAVFPLAKWLLESSMSTKQPKQRINGPNRRGQTAKAQFSAQNTQILNGGFRADVLAREFVAEHLGRPRHQ